MEDLSLEGTAKTPTVDFKSAGELLIKGRSIPENSIECNIKAQNALLRILTFFLTKFHTYGNF